MLTPQPGMLGSAATIEMLARALKDYNVTTTVLDPVSRSLIRGFKAIAYGSPNPVNSYSIGFYISQRPSWQMRLGAGPGTVTNFNPQVMISTTGAQLLPLEAVDELRNLLLPQTFIVTPNIPEAKLLLSRGGKESVEVQCIDDMELLAKKTRELGPKWVLIKGGHVPFRRDGTIAKTDGEKDIVVDVLVGPSGELTRIEAPYQDSRHTHGTGCSLASAIASNLSKGIEPVEAVRAACRYIEAGIRTAPGYGKGHGPLNHFHSTYTLPFTA